MNKNLKLIIRNTEDFDLEEVRQIVTDLDFLTSKYDNEVMIKVDGQGIFVAQDESTGRLVGCCSGVNLSPHFAFIGQYAVRREYQKLGIGQQLWQTVMDHIGSERNIGLYAMQYMANKYTEKYNFNVMAEHKLAWYSGIPDYSSLIQSIDGISVLPIEGHNIEKVIQYDKEICRRALDRTVLITENAKIGEYVNLVAINESNQVLGYCMLKVSTRHIPIIEPLYANDERIAELLIAKCCQSMAIIETNGLLFNCWNTNTKSISMAKKMGLTYFRELPLLFTKQVVAGDMDRIYCMGSRAFYPF